MLADTFKTAAELGISEPGRQVLIEFHRRAAAGEIKDKLFDMTGIGEPHCGTPGCILGWCYAIDPDAAAQLHHQYWFIMTNSGWCLANLFAPQAPHRTPAQAAVAVYNFLTGDCR